VSLLLQAAGAALGTSFTRVFVIGQDSDARDFGVFQASTCPWHYSQAWGPAMASAHRRSSVSRRLEILWIQNQIDKGSGPIATPWHLTWPWEPV